jgi:hypothetical protein
MGIWSAILRVKNKMGNEGGSDAAMLRGNDGWHYEESRDFSSSQSTIRIEQGRPGEWHVVQPSCGIVGLNETGRRDGVSRFFAGSYRWLRLERGIDNLTGEKFVKVIGTSRDEKGRESAVHLGFLQQELSEAIEGEKIGNLWGKIRFIKFPSRGRSAGYLIRFDLMKKMGNGGGSDMVISI